MCSVLTGQMKGAWHRFKNYWKQLPIEGRGSIAVCIPLVCLIGTVVAYTILRHRMVEAQLYVDHTTEVLAQSKGSLISILNAETAVRGYFISTEKTVLQPYDLALKTLNPNLSGLEQLVKDSPTQLERAKLLTQVAQYRMKLLQESIYRVDAGESSTKNVTVERLLDGKRAMDRFRQLISEFEKEEYRLLDLRTRALQEQQQLNADAMWCGIAIGIIGTILAIRILQELAKELRERDIRLRESRNQVEAIVANIVDGVMLIDSKGRVESFNHAAVKMFGYEPNEVIGWDWKKLLNCDAEDTRKLLYYEPELLAKAPPIGQIWQAMGQRKNGELFPIEVSMNSIAFDDDRIAIVRDITDRQQAAAKLQAKALELSQLNDSLNASNYSLRQTNSELDRFAYVTAHDLKAPLRAIASLSEWVEEDLGERMSEETRSQMQLLRRRVYRMQALLNSLLEYSRAGRTQSPIVTVDVNRMIEKIIQTLSPPETFSINIINPLPMFDTRWRPLEQVLTHLIDNAIRHHPTKMGIVEISAIDLGDRYEFSIVDNGDGIEPQYQKRIYTIFQTLKARDLQENIGAGLAIVKKIVNSEGGDIELESIPGKGAIFRFTWLKESITIDASPTSPEPRSKTSC